MMFSDNRDISERDRRLKQWLDRKEELGIKPAPTGINPPLSFGQQRIYFLQTLHPDSAFYHYVEIYQVDGHLEVDRLIAALEKVIERHESLRTNIRVIDGRPVQIINPNARLDTNRLSLLHLSHEEQPTQQSDLIQQEATKPFDLANDPLVRLSIIELGPETFTVVLTMHHIITDQWSSEVIREEWSTAYKNGSISGELPSIQYGDFAYWQRNQTLNKEDLEYWSSKLSGDLPIMKLTSKKRPVKTSYRGKLLEDTLESQFETLKRYCQEMEVTMYVLTLSIFKLLLYRYSGQTDLLVGSPVDNRDKTALERLVGFFNETVVFRTPIDQSWTFRDLVSEVRKTVLEAFEHKNVPFEALVQEIKPDRYLSVNPVFQVMFLYHKSPPNPDFGSELKIGYKHHDLNVSKFDLTLYVLERQQNLSFTFEYASDIFDDTFIKGTQRHLNNLVSGVIEDPDQLLNAYSLLDIEEQRKIIRQWNQTEAVLPQTSGIHELIENHSLADETKFAVQFQDQSLTYEQLDQGASSVAHYLLAKGAKVGDHIGLFTERSTSTLVGIVGILKAGMVYVPIDPDYPPERIGYILEDANIRILLTPESFTFPLSNKVETCRINDAMAFTGVARALPNPDINRTAYLIYTSGTTGGPKGVPVSHGNLISSTNARMEYYPGNPKTFLLLSSFSFDSSIAGIFWTLCTGGLLVLSEHRLEQDMDRLAAKVRGNKISHTLMLPSLYELLLKHTDSSLLESLEVVIVAGEVCKTEVCNLHFEILPTVSLYNEYGPSEATVWSTVHQLHPGDCGKSIPIGKPIPNAKAYILDDSLNTLPVEVIGELYIGGTGVASGYLNRPEQTDRCFVKDPFDKEQGAMMYRTGDLCSFQADGTIVYHGRLDNQLKVRGFRIEPAEIQEVINRFPAVRDSIVVQMKKKGEKELKDLGNDPFELEAALNQMDEEVAEELLLSVELLTNTDG